MDPAQAQPRTPEAPDFVDGLGERTLLTDATSGDSVEILQLRPVLTGVPSFEFALRERTARLANFRQNAFARVRRVDRTPDGLAIVSDHVAGFRLSQMLRVAEERGLPVDTNAALCLIRQLLPAIALLHENAREVSHGALAPERLIITPHARLVVAEYVLGSALEQLQLSHDRLWRDYRIPMPPSAGAPRFDHRADVMQIGITSLSLILGRSLQDDDLARINELLAESTETSAGGARQPLSQGLRGWLARALQLDQRRPFQSARDAQTGLDQALAVETRFVASTVAVEAFISRCVDSIIEGSPIETFSPATGATAAASAPAAAAPAVTEPLDTYYAPEPERPAEEPYYAPEPVHVPEPVRPPEPPRVTEAAQVPQPPRAPEPPRPAAPPMRTPEPHRAAETHRAPEPPKTPRTQAPPRPLDLDQLQQSFATPASSTLFGENVTSEPALFDQHTESRGGRSWGRLIAVIGVLVILGAGGYVGYQKFVNAPAAVAVAETGALNVQSAPAGIDVVVDGVPHGVTPANITLKPGPHILELRGKGTPRVIPITVTAGGTLSQFVEFAESSIATTGQLDVRSDPPGAKVTVDGQPAGTAPTVVPNLSPGEHKIVLERDGTTVQHTVTIEAGVTASLVAPLGAATGGPASGWVSVSAPFVMQIFEEGRLVGTSETNRIMVAAGRHQFEIANETLGYRTTRVVQVAPGKVATVGIELPNGMVNLNAQPWAEVWIDNKRVGETPIGNLSLPIGPHEVVFRHPQLGEKRQAISVTPSTPVRVSIDMRK